MATLAVFGQVLRLFLQDEVPWSVRQIQMVVIMPTYLLTGAGAGLVVQRIHGWITSIFTAGILGAVLAFPLGMVLGAITPPFMGSDYWFAVSLFALVFGGSVGSGIYHYATKPEEPDE